MGLPVFEKSPQLPRSRTTVIGTAHTIYGVLAVCKPLPVVYRLQANKRVVAPKNAYQGVFFRLLRRCSNDG